MGEREQQQLLGPGRGGTGLRAARGRCPGTAAGIWLGKLLGAGNGDEDPARAGRGGERVWNQTHRGMKAAAEDEARPGEEPGAKGGAAKEKASRLRARAEGRVLGGEGTHPSTGAEAPQGRARQLLRPKERHREPEQSPGNTGKQLQWGGRDGKAVNRLWWMKEGTAAEGQTGRAAEESKAVTKGKGARAQPSGREKGPRNKDLRTSPF